MRKINNKSGFSLATVIIAIALTSMLSLVFAQIIVDANKQKSLLESKFEILSINNEIKELLNNTDNCTESLRSLKPTNTPAGLTNKLKFKTNAGTFVDKYPLNTTMGSNIKILSYALSDAESDVDVALENTTHLIVDYGFGNGEQRTRKIKINLALDASNNIQACNSGSRVASGPGASPGGKCVTKQFPFYRAAGTGAVAGDDFTPSAAATVQGTRDNWRWRSVILTCPSKFPLAVSVLTTAACSRVDEVAGYNMSPSGYQAGGTCGMLFLEDNGAANASEIQNAKNACDGHNPRNPYERGWCSITCCDL